jgi:hypothetical protein
MVWCSKDDLRFGSELVTVRHATFAFSIQDVFLHACPAGLDETANPIHGNHRRDEDHKSPCIHF